MQEYDYIVIGSGSGGAVVASRLTEDPGTRVLLLEAGGTDWNPVFRMGIGFYRNKPAGLNWGFVSEPEAHLDNRSIDLPQGRLIGGSSSINGKIYSRGNPADYDEWSDLGCDGWSYSEVLPYFKRAEGSWRGDSAYHGGAGPIRTSPVNPRGLLQEPLLESARRCGHQIVDDLDADPFEGISHKSDITVDARGRRSSTARAYLREAHGRRNLTVMLRSQAQRLIFRDGRAVGVEFVRNGRSHLARARKEIILSAGVYNSARLLLLSGIGPADHLRELGIDVVRDLPGVGMNIADHATYMFSCRTRERITPISQLRFDRAAFHFMRWLTTGTGRFATQPLMAQGLFRTRSELDRPDIQIFFNPVRRDAQLWFPMIRGEQEHRLEAGLILLHPHSRGRLRLASADPNAAPRIALNLLSDPRDAQTMIAAVRLVREIYRSDPMAQLIDREVAPGADRDTDDQILAALRLGLYTVRHPVGSCRMGTDPLSVVDPQLRVRGVAGLRIADASVMPAIPGGNTNAPAIMIGEKAADMIRGLAPLKPETWGRSNHISSRNGLIKEQAI